MDRAEVEKAVRHGGKKINELESLLQIEAT